MKKAAILLSRQPLCPCSKTAWVRSAIEAVQWAGRNGYSLITSTGMQTWELLVTAAAIERVPQSIVVPHTGNLEFRDECLELSCQFALEQTAHEFIALPSDKDHQTKHERLASRDRLIGELADIIIPVSIRKAGSLAALIEHWTKEGKEVVEHFRIEHNSRPARLSYSVSDSLSEEVERAGRDYITHWTRAAAGPWPDETRFEYYQSIIGSPAYPRTAFDTIAHILCCGKIKASRRHMPCDTPCVCFSGQAPASFAPLMRWRARYTEMSFEPYGIGIKRDSAFAAGIRPVIYDDGKRRKSTPEPVWLYQSAGKLGSWELEDEYRCAGDFDLTSVGADSLVCFCRTAAEAADLRARTGIRAIPFVHDTGESSPYGSDEVS